MICSLKTIFPVALIGVLVVMVSSGLQTGWAGNWDGDLENPFGIKPIRLMLEIREGLDGLCIHARDSSGSECDLGEGDLECDENGLCFFYRIPGGSVWSEWLYISLKLEGNSITGTWENELGNRAKIRLRRLG